MNVTKEMTKNYEEMSTWAIYPKQSQSKPISRQRTMNTELPTINKQTRFKSKYLKSDVLNINWFTPRNRLGNSRPQLPKPDCFCHLCPLNLPAMDRRIIINADDFGLCDGVNKAVAQAHTDGVLTSTTIMTNMPAAEKAVKIAKKLPTLGVGVHLNLTEGPPLSQDDSIKSLLGSDGQFAYSPFMLSLLSVAGRQIRKAVRAELTAQIQWVIDHGLKPTHLDSHKHIHAFPALFSMVCQLARRFGIGAIRWPFEPKELVQIPWPLTGIDGRNRAWKVRTMARINRIQNQDFLKNDAVLGIAHTGRIDVNFLKAVALYNSAMTTEVMTHPGYADGLDPEKTRLLHQRKVELDALCSEKTKQYFEDAGIKLVHYGQL